eukprot:39629-Eustigmatos_ZCMA.PRE.1
MVKRAIRSSYWCVCLLTPPRCPAANRPVGHCILARSVTCEDGGGFGYVSLPAGVSGGAHAM